MTVALPSEPANYFHLLRRHALDGVRARWWCSRRSRCCATARSCPPVSDFTGGRFRPVIDDPRYREIDAQRAGVTELLCAAARSSGSSPPPGTSGQER
jgi:2-oxoglutarate decarboxylase